MKKLLILILLSLTCYANDMLNLSKETSSDNEKVIYKDMLAYLVASKNKSQLVVAGSLYATGSNIKDSNGDIIKQNIFLAEKYLLESANLGNHNALTILGGFIIINPEMRKLDPKLIKTEKYLLTAYSKGDSAAGVLLSSVYFEKENYIKGQHILTNCANNGNSEAQFALALLYKDGMKDKKNNIVINKNMKIAESFLNKACSNENKTDKIQKICSNANLVKSVIK